MGRFQKKQFFLALAASMFFMLVPFLVSAAGADLSFSPASGTFQVGQEFSVKVILDPAGAKVNVAEATINFDNQFLSASNVSKDGSVFSLWTADPTISNSGGTVTFSGGTPSAFSAKSTVVTITFKALKNGTAKVSFSKGSVLAADGKGTNVYSGGLDATYTISSAAPQPSAPAPSSAPSVETPELAPAAPKITSSTHPKPDQWYSTSTAKFSWDLPADITSIRLSMSKQSDTKPTVAHTPPIDSWETDNLEEGQWYFSAQFKNDFGWGGIGQEKIMIDLTPPLEFSIQLLDQGVHASAPEISFQTNDELSGMDRYEVSIGPDISKTLYPGDLVDGAFLIPANPGGNTKITVKAYDKAGNFRESSGDFLIPYVAPIVSTGEQAPSATTQPLFTTERLILLLFVFLSGALLSMNIYRKRQFKKEKAIILQEADEAREKTDKIFSAIREELEEQVNILDKRPQLTPAERDLLEKMREVLDLSEELIDTEIEDVRKSVQR